MKLTPLNSRIVLKPVESDKITKSGIILPNNKEEKISLYTVHQTDQSTLLTIGQKVVCSEYSGYDFEEGGQKYKITDEDSILALYED